METNKRVKKIVEKLATVESVNENDKLVEDIGLDSLDMVSLLVMLEEEFQIELKESDMNPYDLVTVDDVIELVKKYKGEQV